MLTAGAPRASFRVFTEEMIEGRLCFRSYCFQPHFAQRSLPALLSTSTWRSILRVCAETCVPRWRNGR
jgi:hypothetical protein